MHTLIINNFGRFIVALTQVPVYCHYSTSGRENHGPKLAHA